MFCRTPAVPGNTNLNDPEFDRQIALRDAYRVMVQYIEDHYERGEVPTGDLLAHLALVPDGRSFDPATLEDFLNASAAVLDEE